MYFSILVLLVTLS